MAVPVRKQGWLFIKHHSSYDIRENDPYDALEGIRAVIDLFEGKTIISLHRVIGLGPGLTPSGDDFLVGLALIFTTVDYPYHSFSQWLINSRNELKKRTNTISFSTLDWAIQGESRERITSFLNELFYGKEEERLKKNASRIKDRFNVWR